MLYFPTLTIADRIFCTFQIALFKYTRDDEWRKHPGEA